MIKVTANRNYRGILISYESVLWYYRLVGAVLQIRVNICSSACKQAGIIVWDFGSALSEEKIRKGRKKPPITVPNAENMSGKVQVT